MIELFAPAIVQARPAFDLRLVFNGSEDISGLPRDFLAMPRVLRGTVPLRELMPFLPEEFRRLPDPLLWSILGANIGGLPGVIMAGGIKRAWLWTATDQFTVPGDWNKRDSIVHALGNGGRGTDGLFDSFTSQYLSGGGGGGAAWAALVDYALTFGLTLDVVVASQVYFGNTGLLLAANGSNAPAISGGFGSPGTGGTAAASVGDQKSAGGNGATGSSLGGGGGGGGAGGPNGAGQTPSSNSGGTADNSQGGIGGFHDGFGTGVDGGDGTDGLSGGFNPRKAVNAGPGGGGGGGLNGGEDGTAGGRYGGGGGGGGASFSKIGTAGLGHQGCVLAINNRSQ